MNNLTPKTCICLQRLLLQRSAPWVIAPGDIEYYSHGGRLGYGSFGEVVRAKWRGKISSLTTTCFQIFYLLQALVVYNYILFSLTI